MCIYSICILTHTHGQYLAREFTFLLCSASTSNFQLAETHCMAGAGVALPVSYLLACDRVQGSQVPIKIHWNVEFLPKNNPTWDYVGMWDSRFFNRTLQIRLSQSLASANCSSVSTLYDLYFMCVRELTTHNIIIATKKFIKKWTATVFSYTCISFFYCIGKLVQPDVIIQHGSE